MGPLIISFNSLVIGLPNKNSVGITLWISDRVAILKKKHYNKASDSNQDPDTAVFNTSSLLWTYLSVLRQVEPGGPGWLRESVEVGGRGGEAERGPEY